MVPHDISIFNFTEWRPLIFGKKKPLRSDYGPQFFMHDIFFLELTWFPRVFFIVSFLLKASSWKVYLVERPRWYVVSVQTQFLQRPSIVALLAVEVGQQQPHEIPWGHHGLLGLFGLRGCGMYGLFGLHQDNLLRGSDSKTVRRHRI